MSLTAASWANMNPEAMATILASLAYSPRSTHRPSRGTRPVLLHQARTGHSDHASSVMCGTCEMSKPLRRERHVYQQQSHEWYFVCRSRP